MERKMKRVRVEKKHGPEVYTNDMRHDPHATTSDATLN